MIRISCPFCGPRDHAEFSYGGDGSITYPALDAPLEAWHDAVFLRENICGRQVETWQHVHGCRLWLKVERDTMTHEIYSVTPAQAALAKVLEGGA
ncbi:MULTISPECIES: sarcosine oxidase subunit delta [unclassified Roseovarius]|uniref:sarcosine oxidase subunit delta n=1 Tax=unclassified Roseovarius TaxID=2614913 RepID=UPI0030097F34